MAIKTIIVFLVGLTLASVHLAEAQQQPKVAKIGWLAVRPASAASVIESFQREFGKLGYVEGKNIVFEYRYAEGKLDRPLPWLMSWSVSKLTYFSRPRPLVP
jgi:putative ABC transport system substrate-binding protein